MKEILDSGITIVLWFQGFHPTLDGFFKVLTFMGTEIFFFLLFSLVYWCMDRRIGARLTILFLISACVNSVVKVLLDQPRPYEYDSRVKAIVKAGGGGLPSGHTQSAVIVWGYLAWAIRKPWAWILAAVLMIFIPLSRIYLGVHFPTDLLGGYLLGGVMLYFYVLWAPKAEALLRATSPAWVAVGVILLSAVLAMLVPGADDYGISAAGALAGAGSGFVLEEGGDMGFEPSAHRWRRMLSLLIGWAGLFAIWLGLRFVFQSLDPVSVFRFVRYGLTGFWLSAGAPWCFRRLRLSE